MNIQNSYGPSQTEDM